MNSPVFIQTDRLQFAYAGSVQRPVLKDIGLQIEPQEYLLICGASGSGKSTLCRTFNGLIPHFYAGRFEGSVRVAGIDTADSSVGDLFATVGMVFQNPETQLFNQTVESEMAFGLESLGLPRKDIRARIRATAEAVQIDALLERNPHELSGGEQQLVALAAILALRPRVIVLDEPYANLDPVNVERIRQVLASIHQGGTGIIINEHRLPLTIGDVQRVVLLNDGQIVREGRPDAAIFNGMETFGVELPLAVKISQVLGLGEAAMDLKALAPILSTDRLLYDLLPDELELPPDGAPPVLEVKQVSSHIDGESVLDKISFTLKRGECLAIVGANGAGKTTLLKHLNGLYRPSRGSILINGNDTRQMKVSQLARSVGMAFQNPNSQFFKLNVKDEITIGAQTLGCFDETWIRELVDLFRLEALLERAPYRLSEGEKKRVAFASALAARPAILALDEPTAGQDMFFRQALGQLLGRLAEYGQAVLLVTQDLAFAERYAHRWLLMADGKVVVEGRPNQVMADENAMKRSGLLPTDAFRLRMMLGGDPRHV